MKKTGIIVVSLLVLVAVALFFIPEKESLNDGFWENAIYTEDTTLGTGKKSLILTVEAGDKAIDFTIRTNATTVGEALKEHNLISGTESDTGIYIKFVNGIEADYDKDMHFWGFYKKGEFMPTGVDSTPLNDGDCYELVRTK